MTKEVAYIPGCIPDATSPLARYLPLVPEGVLTTWLGEHIPNGGWLLDPFGASPLPAVEAARAGYRVVVASNNPIDRFLFDLTANPPSKNELSAALADLGAAFKGEQRIEPHIRSLYMTQCAQCGQEVMANAFIWDHGASVPSRRVYSCSHCADTGEHLVTQEDQSLASQFSSGLYHALALERVAPPGDPDRKFAEEALDVYLPRAIYVLFTLLNKLESRPVHHRRCLTALLLAAFDHANTLWPYPAARSRPRQLNIPNHYRENNIWQSLEEAIGQWSQVQSPEQPIISIASWPEFPPATGGITIFPGRLKEFLATTPRIHFDAVASALPRQNQAYWTLSALWSGWLWGKEAAAPYKSVLRRHRYDWAWHCSALHTALLNLNELIETGTPILYLITEAEPGFLTSAVLANVLSGMEFLGLTLRADQDQAQLHWRSGRRKPTKPVSDESGKIPPDNLASISNQIRDLSQKAAEIYLGQRGEPASYLTLHAVALESLKESDLLRSLEDISPAELYSQTQNAIQQTFLYHGGFLRYGGSSHSVEVGQWWLEEPDLSSFEGVESSKTAGIGGNIPYTTIADPLSDRVEMEIVRYLHKNPGSSFKSLDYAICNAFPGLMTPDYELCETCVESYGKSSLPGNRTWELSSQEASRKRRSDLAMMADLLVRIGQRLDYSTSQALPDTRLITWSDSTGEVKYAFYLVTSAVVGRITSRRDYPPDRCWIIYPGGRAALFAYKLKTNSRLKWNLEQGWRLVKYRHIRRLAESQTLDRLNLDEQLTIDPIAQKDSQIPLL